MTDTTDRHRMALKLRLGLGGEREHSFDEIAEALGTTRIKARELVNLAMRKLRYGDIKISDFTDID